MSGDSLNDLAARVRRLEDESAIRALKARYLRSCDIKDVDGVRQTLMADGAVIEFEGFPPFADREPFLAVYQQFGCVPGIFDIHHGANAEIAFEGADRATARWSLLFHNINLSARTLTQMGVEYDDIYIRRDGRWWIAETASRRTSFLLHSVGEDGAPRVTAMGEAPGAFGET